MKRLGIPPLQNAARARRRAALALIQAAVAMVDVEARRGVGSTMMMPVSVSATSQPIRRGRSKPASSSISDRTRLQFGTALPVTGVPLSGGGP